MKRLFLLILLLSVLLCGCSIETDKLVIVDKLASTIKGNSPINVIPVDSIKNSAAIEKTREQLKNIPDTVRPLLISPDFEMVLAYTRNLSISNDEVNANIIIGNVYEYVDLLFINTVDKSTIELGTFLSPKDYAFSEDSQLFSMIDGKGDVYTYNFSSHKLKKIIASESYPNIKTVSWSKDSKRVMLDTKLVFDIGSNEFISIAATSYTPFLKYKFTEELYLAEMRDYLYNNVIALYNIKTQVYTVITDGHYIDCDGINLIYTSKDNYRLNQLNLKTLEKNIVHEGIIYDAQILKSTGDIVFSTINTRIDASTAYTINMSTASKKTMLPVQTSSPTFFISPDEYVIYVTNSYMKNDMIIRFSGFNVMNNNNYIDNSEMSIFKKMILQMFLLDYSNIKEYNDYEVAAKKIFANNYSIVPLEALTDKLNAFKKNKVPLLPIYKLDAFMPSEILITNYLVEEDYANIALNTYYASSLDCIKQNGSWRIVGISTHAKSPIIKDIEEFLDAYFKDLKTKNQTILLPYGTFDQAAISKLITYNGDFKHRIGEIEFWMSNGIHHVADVNNASIMNVKVSIMMGNEVQLYKVVVSKVKNGFEIKSMQLN